MPVVVKRENYITVQGWMVKDLGLKGNGLLVYALIYGFTQEESQWFEGSLRYISEWINATKRTTLNTLQDLVEQGLLKKQDYYKNDVKYAKYRAVSPVDDESFSTVVKKLHGGGEKTSPGVVKSFHGGGEKTSPNNIDDNANYNLSNNDREGTKRKRFTPPTFEEVEKYCLERKNSINPAKFMSYYESNGWRVGGKSPMRDWKAAVRSWELREDDYKPKNGKPDTSEDWSDDLDGYI